MRPRLRPRRPWRAEVQCQAPPIAIPDGTEVVSLDVFDTALVRLVSTPTQVFDLVAAGHAATRPGPGYDFSTERVDAERQARVLAEAAGVSEDVTLEQIYTRLSPPAGWDPMTLQQLELETEVAVARPNPAVLELYRTACARGIPVVFVSDMYLPGKLIGEMLTTAGYGRRAGLFVSCEVGTTKASGRLYEHVVSQVGVKPSRIFHVGDNETSDVRMARKAGLRARHLPVPPGLETRAEPGPVPRTGLAVARKLALTRRLAQAEPESFWDRFGYEVAGPLLVGFVGWMTEQVRSEGCERVYFLARDGWIMHQIYELLEGAVPAEYVYASRRAFRVPVAGTAPQLDVEALLDTVTAPLSVGHYLERVGLDAAVNEPAIRAAGFVSPAALVATDEHRARLVSLLGTLSEEIRVKAEEEREALLTYFGQIGLVNARSVAVVDIGWHGSLQAAMSQLISEATNPGPDILGLYVATAPGAAAAASRGNTMKAFICNFGVPAQRQRAITVSAEIWEFIHRAPHGTLLRFRLAPDGTAEPVFGANDSDTAELAAVAQMHDGARAFARDWSELSSALGGLALTAAEACAPIGRVTLAPTRHEAAMLGDLTAVRGMGKGEVHETFAPALSLTRALGSPATALHGYEQALWRRGFSRRLFPGPLWFAGHLGLEAWCRVAASARRVRSR